MENIENAQLDQPIGLRYNDNAAFWHRFGAFAIDAVLVWVVSAGLIFLGINDMDGTPGKMPFAFALLIKYLYYPLMEGFYGATLGKMAFGLVIVDKSMRKIGFDKAFLRNLPRLFYGCLMFAVVLQPVISSEVAGIVVFLVFVVDLFAYGNSLERQALHDTIARTYVINRPSALQ